jgi:hypothetical protein
MDIPVSIAEKRVNHSTRETSVLEITRMGETNPDACVIVCNAVQNRVGGATNK